MPKAIFNKIDKLRFNVLVYDVNTENKKNYQTVNLLGQPLKRKKNLAGLMIT